jgi:ATP synthase protein I
LTEEEENRKRARLMGVFITLPLVLAISPLLGWWIGRWLDTYFGTAPYLMIVSLLLGLAAGVREFYRIVKRYGDGSGVK